MNVHDDKSNNGSYDCCPPGSHGSPVIDGAATTTTASASDPAAYGDIPASYFDEAPKGEFITLNGFKDTMKQNKTPTPCYYTAPPPLRPQPESISSSSSPGSKYGLIVYPDVWGFQSRILRIADYLSSALNCHVVVCDCFRGETKDTQPDIVAWFQNVSYDEIVEPDTVECFLFLKQQKNVTEFAALGFCWGAWAIGKTCQAMMQQSAIETPPPPPPTTTAATPENSQQIITPQTTTIVPSWKAVVSPHPSFGIEKKVFGGDDVKLMQCIPNVCPLLLLPAGNDPQYTKPTSDEFLFLLQQQRHQQHSADTKSNGKCGSSKSIEFPEMKHGWTTRGDLLSNEIPLKRDLVLALHEIVDFLRINLLSSQP